MLRAGTGQFLRIAAALLGTVTPCGAVAAAPDAIFMNARVYTVDERRPWAEAFAVTGRRFSFVGDDAGARALAGPDTLVVDLAGSFVMPGINDGHLHPVLGTLRDLFTCVFPMTADADSVAGTLRGCAGRTPPGQWLRGGSWGSDFFARSGIDDPRAWLARVLPDHPAMLADDSAHDAWINARAMRLLGIDADTPDPAGGRYERDAAGRPTGVLRETAMREVRDRVPGWTGAQWREAMAAVSTKLNAHGITGARNAGMYPDGLAAMRRQGRTKGFTVHFAVSMRTPYGPRDEPLDIDAIDAMALRSRSATADTRFVKIFLDGVPTPARTAFMLAPYLTDPEHPEPTRGESFLAMETLAVDLIGLDSRGYRVKLHTAGDASVRLALDAIAEMRAVNGQSGRHVELAHAGYVAPEDVSRFAALQAVPDLSPVLWHPSGINDAIVSVVGERARRYFPVRDFIDSGALVIAGSDWPAVGENASPWGGIEALVTRAHPQGTRPGTLWPEQAITLAEAVRIYTRNGAHAIGMAHMTGAIEAGRYADFIVLDRNLFEVPIGDVSETQVQETWFMGRRVWQRPEGG